jgi:hypothetical protein
MRCREFATSISSDVVCGKIPWVDYWDCWARRHNDQAFHSKCMTCSSYVHLFLIDWL